LRNIEAVLVLRILNNLGYIGGDEKLQNLVKSPFEQELILEISKSRMEVLRQINKALRRHIFVKYLPRRKFLKFRLEVIQYSYAA